MRPDTKRCPECAEEFLPTAEVCSDCGVPLRLAAELDSGAGDHGMPPATELVLIRAEGPAWVEALADRLAQEEIPSRVEIIDPRRHGIDSGVVGSACGLFVRGADEARAREIDAIVQVEQIPDMPGDAPTGEAEGCPACGHSLGAEDTECSDCGLSFA